MRDLWNYYEKCKTDGEIRLARAVLERAILDAEAKRDSYDRQQSRKFLTAENSLWENSLREWAELAEISADAIIRRFRKKYNMVGEKPAIICKGADNGKRTTSIIPS